MKKKICLILALIIVVAVSAIGIAVGEPIKLQDSIGEDARFTNGYKGFCLDAKKDAIAGENFSEAANTSSATNNTNNSDISKPLKALFTQNFEDIFEPDGNGGYRIIDKNTVQYVVYMLTGDYTYATGTAKQLLDSANANAHLDIPDEGYTITLDNGDVITFSFMVLVPEDEENIQYFFAYKLYVNQVPTHEHKFAESWESDETNHWHECECGEKANIDEHEKILRDYKEAKEFEEGYTGDQYCQICDELLKKGEVIPMTHVHDYKLKNDDKEHWRECSCNLPDKIVDKAEHEGELRNEKPAKEFEEGYTGDEYCKVCDELLKKGEVIPMTHVHHYRLKNDDKNHWRECSCNLPDKIVDKAEHEGELRNNKPAKEFEDGYTGDEHCKDCDKLLKKGEVIPMTHVHDYKLKHDDKEHWRECDCNLPDKIIDKEEHEGNLRNEKPAKEFEEGYTGDEYCKVCNELLKKGEVIPMTHVHHYRLKHDDKNHWRECSCDLEDKIVDKAEHEAELRNQKEASESEEGYTGDLYCKNCERLLQKGEPIPVLSKDEPENNTPPTGDNSNLMIWSLVAVIMALGVMVSSNYRKNRD